MTAFVGGIDKHRHPEERRQARLEGRDGARCAEETP
jgi:hypothetical protein